MFEVATTIIELVANLLDPGAYVAGVVANIRGCRRARAGASDEAHADDDTGDLQVRIGIVGPGKVPAYRIERVDDGQATEEVFGAFDGVRHEPLRERYKEATWHGTWSGEATRATDVERLMVVLRRSGKASGIPVRSAQRSQ